MGKYCCFWCPGEDYTEKALADLCPQCGRRYGFPLEYAPQTVGAYRVLEPLNRGFYAATYVATAGLLGVRHVLKVAPTALHAYFRKGSFEDEARVHANVAMQAEHIVGILDAFEESLTLTDHAGTRLPCYVSVLEYVDGRPLTDYLEGAAVVSAGAICQIAMDLLRIREEFATHLLNHNDLHADNLIVETLRESARRADAICDSIRVRAIDLGSVADESKSGGTRQGDIHFIAEHVAALVGRLLESPQTLDDRDYRVALALQGLALSLQAPGAHLRLPNLSDLRQEVREAYMRASQPWRPWRQPFQLRGLSDHYNTQTLDSWYVPRLLVDPDGRWLREIAKPGPQVITGIRGCGKTMLLRALDIHARLAQTENESPDEVVQRVLSDGIAGLYGSAQKLLDVRRDSLLPLERRLAKLFAHYSLQAARALLHVRDVAPVQVTSQAHHRLGGAIADFLDGTDAELRRCVSLDELESRLLRIVLNVLVLRKPERFALRAAPSEAFAHLAEQFRSCAELLHGATVLFLLDDVSTRYLDLPNIGDLLSVLLFQSPVCAFKFTSEGQTIELGLRSPGRTHLVREGRDLTIFDLGADVLATVGAQGAKGREFISGILGRRTALTGAGRGRSPREILGDVTLEQIAREIADSSDTSDSRKTVYRGLSCLAGVCVGDIGDVIKLYEAMLRKLPEDGATPLKRETQSRCFLDFCSGRLYDLNRRSGAPCKDHALAFAQAAHDLLVRSYRNGTSKTGKPSRLRQYSHIYVRVTVGDEGSRMKQIDALRDLIDAGVFVFAGGIPRTKTKDADPIQQFILMFRKIFGLAAFIGLADRDRFELSGEELVRWLEEPAEARAILLRNQVAREMGLAEEESGGADTAAATQGGGEDEGETSIGPAESRQGELFVTGTDAAAHEVLGVRPLRLDVRISEIGAELSELAIGAVVTGLGFEERTRESNKFLANSIAPRLVYAVRYPVDGYRTEILEAWRARVGSEVRELSYAKAKASVPTAEGLCLVDVSGLTKPVLFAVVRRELAAKGRVLVCRAAATGYYPLEEDLEALLAAEAEQEPITFLERLAEVLTGERGDYTDYGLIDEEADPSRSRALLAFVSPKHERLFSLLDRREYEYIEVIAPAKNTPRARVAVFAAEYVCKNYPNARMVRLDTDDLPGVIAHLDARYLDIYDEFGANVELGLTGSKVQAVAAAILSAGRKIAQAWYLEPREFDAKRFSIGVGQIRLFDISLACGPSAK